MTDPTPWLVTVTLPCGHTRTMSRVAAGLATRTDTMTNVCTRPDCPKEPTVPTEAAPADMPAPPAPAAAAHYTLGAHVRIRPATYDADASASVTEATCAACLYPIGIHPAGDDDHPIHHDYVALYRAGSCLLRICEDCALATAHALADAGLLKVVRG